MIKLPFVQGMKIGVVGLGKTGIASVNALRDNGAIISVWDDAEEKRIEAMQNGIAILNLETDAPEFLLWSPGITHYGDKAHPLAVAAKEKSIALVCDIDLFVRSVPNDILAVTGTNGKSTTTALIAHTLAQFRPSLAGGNIGEAVLGLDALPDEGSYVLELSSYQLELTPHLKPAGAVLLNITPDHLARHGDMDTYVAAKKNIFAGVPDDARKPAAIICIDSEIAAKAAAEMKADARWAVVPVSTQNKQPDGVHVDQGKLYDHGEMIFDLGMIPSLKGRHNHENIACAYALIRNVYGYEPQKICQAMTSFAGLPHRQFLVRTINGISYINDSKATNADAVSHALGCMKNIYWILGGQAKDGGLSGLENYMDRIRHAFLIGDASDQFATWLQQFNIPFTKCGTMDVAVLEAHALAQTERGMPGEPGSVLLSPACASWDQFQSFEHRGDVFAALVEGLAEE